MLQAREFTNEELIKRLRTLSLDLHDKDSPFNKDEKYLNEVGGWLASAAARIEKLSTQPA